MRYSMFVFLFVLFLMVGCAPTIDCEYSEKDIVTASPGKVLKVTCTEGKNTTHTEYANRVELTSKKRVFLYDNDGDMKYLFTGFACTVEEV